MSLLNDIRKQPQGTREIMFGLSVFITVLSVGLVWFHSFQKNLYVLMNSEEEVQKMLAVENAPVPSLFGLISQTAADIKGLVSNLLNQEPRTKNQEPSEKIKVEKTKVYMLPLSEHK